MKIKVEYSNYFVAFLDALGFKKSLKDEEKVSLYFDKIYYLIEERYQESSKVEIRSISDSIVLAVKSEEKSYVDLETLVQVVCDFQIEALKIGFPVRGGLAYGKLYIYESIVTGPALAKTYNIEQSLAHLPRVLFDTSSLPIEYVSGLLRYGEVEGYYSTSFVRNFFEKKSDEKDSDLQKISEVIKKGLVEDMAHYPKYRYLNKLFYSYSNDFKCFDKNLVNYFISI